MPLSTAVEIVIAGLLLWALMLAVIIGYIAWGHRSPKSKRGDRESQGK